MMVDKNEGQYECIREKNLLHFKVNGFPRANKLAEIKEAVCSAINAVDGQPYRILFDLRGLKPLDKDGLTALKEINERLAKCSAAKIGSVFDSIVSKMQHERIAKEISVQLLEEGRAKLFDNLDECLAWLKS